MTSRRDWAVILARGESRRMGRPKGLVRAADDPRPLLARIAALYAARGVPVCIATSPALAAAYGATVPAGLRPVWALHPPGGGTAATCLAAVARLDGRATHLWFHPVDLPRVLPETLDRLADASREEPESVIVPFHGEDRGHPVIAPLAPWRGRDPAEHPDAAMRDLIAASGIGIRSVRVSDPGTVADLDAPGDLSAPGTPGRIDC